MVKKAGKIFFRILLIVTLVLLTLIVGLYIAFGFNVTRNYAAGKAADYLSAKIRSEVRIGAVGFSPDQISIHDLYIEDRNQDTLLFAQQLQVNFNLLKLFSKTIAINGIEIYGLNSRLSRIFPDSSFNFSFISQAFQGDGEDVAIEDSVPSTWKIEIRRLKAEHCRLAYEDDAAGIRLRFGLGSLTTVLDNTDLESLDFSMNNISIVNTTADIELRKPLREAAPDTDTGTVALQILLGTGKFQNISVTIHDSVSNNSMLVRVGELGLENGSFSLQQQEIGAGLLRLNNSGFSHRIYRTVKTTDGPLVENSLEPETGIEWKIHLKQLELQNNTFEYNDDNEPELATGMDYSHLQVRGLGLKATDIDLKGDHVSLQLQSMQLTEKSGFGIKNFTARIWYGPEQVRVEQMRLETGHSLISKQARISYPSLSAVSVSPALLAADIDLEARLSFRDLRIFVPGIFNDSLLRRDAEGALKLSAVISGRLESLQIRNFDLAAPGIHLQTAGRLDHVLQPSGLYADLSTLRLNGYREGIFKILPEHVYTRNFNLPDTFSLKAQLKGYLKNFDTDLHLHTSSGTLIATVKMNPEAGNIEQPYTMHIGADDLDLGYMLRQPEMLGKMSLMADISGSGYDTSNLDTRVNLTVVQAEVNKYNYTNLDVKGHFLRRSFTGSAAINDRNLAFDFTGKVNLDPGQTEYKGRLHLKGADFKKLHLTEQELRLSMLVNTEMELVPGRNPAGTVRVTDILMIKDERRYLSDSIVLHAVNDSLHSELRLTSGILSAEIKGKYLTEELGGKLIQHLNSYFEMIPDVDETVLAAQDYSFALHLHDPQVFNTGLVPGLEQLMPFSVKGSFNSLEKDLRLEADLPRVVYAGMAVDSLRLNVNSDPSELKYTTNIAQVSDSSLKFENVFLGGIHGNNNARFQFSTAKDDSTKLLSIAGNLVKDKDNYVLRLEKDIVLNAEEWRMDSLNYMEFGKNIFYAKDVNLRMDQHLLSINSSGKELSSPAEIRFENFEISTISLLMENREGLMQGNINGFIGIEKHGGNTVFKSDLEIRDLVFKASPLGTLRLKADNYEDVRKYDIALELKGNGNDLELKGSYNPPDKNNAMDLQLDVKQLDLASMEPFTAGQATRLAGTLNGSLRIRGMPSKPEINGKLQFKNAGFEPEIIGSYLKIPIGELLFESGRIKMRNLVFYDTLNKPATVNGYVSIRDLKDISFDLRVHTDNFLAMNTNRKSNPLYFGRIFLKSDLRLSGTSDLPVIDVKARLNKGSHFTYVKPESALTRDESTGIVEFTDSLHQYNTIMEIHDTLPGRNLQGFELNAVIEVDRTVDIKMLIDPLSGDSLFLKGGGKLDFAMDRSGKTSLTGKYVISEGGYYLTISEFIKRDFRIKKGSSVTWSGDMLDAFVELEAIYRIKASPIDLVQDQMAGVSELEMNKYRNLLSFEVYLKMTGFISNPQISFDIQLAPEDRGAMGGAINTRLAQLRDDETQMNKQVFALLTLRRFIGENPLESGSESGFSSASRSSASKVLTQQLGSLADRYVNFVDLDLGVNSYEDYSTGQQEGRTQLQVGVSKQMFNDRVTVRVGGNVDLEGERAKQNSANDVAGNISVDYKLTEDGRYKAKAFRENQYENPIEGELTKTGAGIVFTRDFNKFKNLFKKPERRHAANKEK